MLESPTRPMSERNLVYYGITVKYMKSDREVNRDLYDIWLANATAKGMLFHKVCYEEDSHSRLHFHALASARPNIYLKKFQIYGFHQHIFKIKTEIDCTRWNQYMIKDQKARLIFELSGGDKERLRERLERE